MSEKFKESYARNHPLGMYGADTDFIISIRSLFYRTVEELTEDRRLLGTDSIDGTRPRRNGSFYLVANFIRFGEIDKANPTGYRGPYCEWPCHEHLWSSRVLSAFRIE